MGGWGAVAASSAGVGAVVAAVYHRTLQASIPGGDRYVSRGQPCWVSLHWLHHVVLVGPMLPAWFDVRPVMVRDLARIAARACVAVLWAAFAAVFAAVLRGSGELVAEACVLGVAHPPGYPLFTLWTRLVSLVNGGPRGALLGSESPIPAAHSRSHCHHRRSWTGCHEPCLGSALRGTPTRRRRCVLPARRRCCARRWACSALTLGTGVGCASPSPPCVPRGVYHVRCPAVPGVPPHRAALMLALTAPHPPSRPCCVASAAMAGVCASLCYALSPLVWGYSVTAEVFAMNNLFGGL